MTWFPSWLDAAAIAPFRCIEEPLPAFWLGSVVLAGVCVMLGQLSLKVATAVNGRLMEGHVGDASRYQETSLSLLRAGHGDRFKGVNQLANEAFGKAFFLGVAWGAASLWPLFFAAAWLEMRFSGMRIPLGIGEITLSHVAPLLLAYVALRVIIGWMPHRLMSLWAQKPSEDG